MNFTEQISRRVRPAPPFLLSEVDGGRRNNLNPIRLALATGVIFSHCYAILGIEGREPITAALHFGGNLGDIGVFGFFFVSGYLITRSARKDNEPRRFLRARVFRLLPGLVAATLFCVFLIGPLSTRQSLHSYFEAHATYRYLGTIVLIHKAGLTLPNVFNRHPITEINLPLWTLASEWCCYLAALSIALIAQPRNARRKISAGSWGVLIFAACMTAAMLPLPYRFAWKWAAFFIVGGLCFHLRRRIVLYPRLSIFTLVLSLVLMRFAPPIGKSLFPFTLCYFLLCIGFHPKYYVAWFEGWGDLSYGLYIFAWPIQQMASEHFASPGALFVVSYGLVLPLAACSWHFVESPCLSWARNEKKPRLAPHVPVQFPVGERAVELGS